MDGNYYVEVKDYRYKIHQTEINILGLRDEPKSLRIQYQVQNDTHIRKKQKVLKNDIDEVILKNYPENEKQQIHQPKLKPPNCASCKRNIWLDFDKG